METPKVMLLGGDALHSLPIAAEVKHDTEACIVGIGRSRRSRLLRSRYCDQTDTLSEAERADESALLTLVDRYDPDVVLPTAFNEMALLEKYRDSLKEETNLCLPPRQSFHTAVSKRRTYEVASDLRISVPSDFTPSIEDRSVESIASELDYPVFLKGSKEIGGNATKRVDSPRAFKRAYAELDSQIDDGEVLIQEYIGGSNHTYGYGFLFDHGDPVLSFGHLESRSVPREGGSATRVRSYRNDVLESASSKLLRSLNWHGVALVEFMEREDGSFVLMEINPKFWASYALASRCGYRFASLLIDQSLDQNLRLNTPSDKKDMEMVFPLRELNHYLVNRDEESLIDCATSMLWPPARWDVDVRDLRAWITLPQRFG